MQNPPFQNKRQQFENEFQDKMIALTERLSRVTKETEDLLTNKKTINKSDRATILNELGSLKMELASNIPFMGTAFNEHMDNVSHEAKSEVEAFTITKLHQLGLDRLHELQLESKSKAPALNQPKEGDDA